MTLPYEVARAMREIPETRYAKTPDGVHIAFQVVGDGPLDLVLVPGLFSQVEHHWDEPSFAHFLQYLATLILEAKLVELPGTDHLPYVGDSDSILDEAEEFFDGHPTSLRPSRVLATVAFTDIVGSTERAGRLGDRAWRELLDRHHAVVRQELGRFRGTEVHTAGDGSSRRSMGPLAGSGARK